MRRRQRLLRSWWRHEQRSVAAATHHSAPRSGWPEQHNAPRGPTTASVMEEEVREVNDALEGLKRPPPAERPAPLSEVAGPQAAVTVGYVAAGVLLLGAPSMASPSAEAIDESTLSFLLAENLARVKEKEEVEELVADLDRREQKLMEAIERHRASVKRGDLGSRVEAAAAWWFMAKTALAERRIIASPGRYTNTGRVAPAARVPTVLHDPGGASSSESVNAPEWAAQCMSRACS